MKNLNFTLLFSLFTISLLTSCDDKGKYVMHEGTICYSYWTFSFGYMYDSLPEVDTLTFRSVNNWVGHDDRHVYFKDKLAEGADPATLEVLHYPLFRDHNDYYYKGVAMQVEDTENLKFLKKYEDNFWATDGRYAYYDTLRIEADLETFSVEDWHWAKDKYHVYYFGKILEEADPATYKPLPNSLYAKDKSHVWCGSTLMKDVDYETFSVDKNGKASDKYGTFYYEDREEEREE